MGGAESRNTVQPQSSGGTSAAFSAVTPSGVVSPVAAKSARSSGANRFFQRGGATLTNTDKEAKRKKRKHKTNALVPEPLLPTASTPAVGPSLSLTGQQSTVVSDSFVASTSLSIDAIASTKSVESPVSSPTATAAAAGPSPQLLLPDKEPTTADKQSSTPLTFEDLSIQFLKAVKNGDVAAMERIAAMHPSHAAALINIRGMWESTPLIYACQYSHAHAAMWLLERGASVHVQNEKGVTSLLLASLEGMLDAVNWILQQSGANSSSAVDNSANTTELQPFGVSPSSDAASAKRLDFVPIDQQIGVVYNSVADLNIRLNPLLAASMNGHVEIAAALLARGANANCGVPASAAVATNKQFALLLAAKYGHASVVHLLIKHGGADVATSNANESHALLLACEASHEECAMELLRLIPVAPTAVTSSGDSTLDTVSSTDAYATAWKRPNTHGITALHCAAANGLLAVVQRMLVQLAWRDDRAFVNATSVNRRECALLMACRKRQSDVVALLLTCGADCELADRGGTTALQVLKREKRDELVKLCESSRQQRQQSTSAESSTIRSDDIDSFAPATDLPATAGTNTDTCDASAAAREQIDDVDDEVRDAAVVVHSDNVESVEHEPQETTLVDAVALQPATVDTAALDASDAHEPVNSIESHPGDTAAPDTEAEEIPLATAKAAQAVDEQHMRGDTSERSASTSDEWIDPPSKSLTTTTDVSAATTAAALETVSNPVAQPPSALLDTVAIDATESVTCVPVGETESSVTPLHNVDAAAAALAESVRDTSSTAVDTVHDAIAPSLAEEHVRTSKKPSRPKHRKRDHQAPAPRRPRQKKSVVTAEDDAVSAGDASASAPVDRSAVIAAAPCTEPVRSYKRPHRFVPATTSAVETEAALSTLTHSLDVSSSQNDDASIASDDAVSADAAPDALDVDDEASARRERRKKKKPHNTKLTTDDNAALFKSLLPFSFDTIDTSADTVESNRISEA